MDEFFANISYRSLERICGREAALSTNPDTRDVLARMALEYKQLADKQDRRWREADECVS